MKMRIKGELNGEKFILTAKQDKDTKSPLDGADPSVIDGLVMQLHKYLNASKHLDVASEYEEDARDFLEDILSDNDIKKVKLEVKSKCEDGCSDCCGEYISTMKIKRRTEKSVGLNLFRFMSEDPDLYQMLCEKYPLDLGEYDIDVE